MRPSSPPVRKGRHYHLGNTRMPKNVRTAKYQPRTRRLGRPMRTLTTRVTRIAGIMVCWRLPPPLGAEQAGGGGGDADQQGGQGELAGEPVGEVQGHRRHHVDVVSCSRERS